MRQRMSAFTVPKEPAYLPGASPGPEATPQESVGPKRPISAGEQRTRIQKPGPPGPQRRRKHT